MFTAPFWRFGHIKIGGRGTLGKLYKLQKTSISSLTTLVRLQTGGVAVFSPVALTPDVKETVASMGELKYIAALDIEHHIFLGPWHEEYPKAKIIGVEGLPEKRTKQKNEEVPFAAVFSKANHETLKVDEEFDSEFEYEYVSSHPNKELVFFHKPSKTLIEADFMFNLPATEQFSKSGQDPTSGILTKLFTLINSTAGQALGQKRFMWYAISSSDRTGWNASVAKINKWDFDTIVPCHGDVIETGGKGIFQKVFEWHLAGVNNQSKKSS